jgi:hypothetical protein
MAVGTLGRVGARNAAEICKRFDVGPEASVLLKPEHSPDRYLDALMDQKLWMWAIRFLAHALPKPEAVWWACLCARTAAGANPAPPVRGALEAAETWLKDPSENRRQATMAAAQAAGLTTAAGSAALAAFVSGGSLGPSNIPPVPPGENMTGQIVGAGILLAAIQNGVEKAMDNFQAYLAKGIEVAKGTSRWPAGRS